MRQVFFAFPVMITSLSIIKGIILFKRGSIVNKDVSPKDSQRLKRFKGSIKPMHGCKVLHYCS